MGCIYSNFNGDCSMWNEDGNNIDGYGFDYEDGGCWAENDPDPSISCETYESDGND